MNLGGSKKQDNVGKRHPPPNENDGKRFSFAVQVLSVAKKSEQLTFYKYYVRLVPRPLKQGDERPLSWAGTDRIGINRLGDNDQTMGIVGVWPTCDQC